MEPQPRTKTSLTGGFECGAHEAGWLGALSFVIVFTFMCDLSCLLRQDIFGEHAGLLTGCFEFAHMLFQLGVYILTVIAIIHDSSSLYVQSCWVIVYVSVGRVLLGHPGLMWILPRTAVHSWTCSLHIF